MSAPARPRIGVVGAGWWAADAHLPSLRSFGGCELRAVADTNRGKLDAVRRRYGVERLYDDTLEMLEREALDGVVVAVPHAAHHEVARAALDRGLHVLVEKPLALTARDAWDLVGAAERGGLILMVGYTHQFTRAAAWLRAEVGSGKLGELIHVAGLSATALESFLRGRPADYQGVFAYAIGGPGVATYSTREQGGGQAYSQLAHGLGLITYLTGERATEVSAFMNRADLAVDLTDAIALRLRGGATATVSSTGSLRPGQREHHEYRYYFTGGFIVQDVLLGVAEIHHNDGAVERLTLADHEICPPLEPARRFAQAIAGRPGNPAPGPPAARAVEILEAAHRSAERGLTVSLPEDTGPTQ